MSIASLGCLCKNSYVDGKTRKLMKQTQKADLTLRSYFIGFISIRKSSYQYHKDQIILPFSGVHKQI